MPGGHSAVVLLADDDAPLRALCRRALGAAGFRVLEAADGVEALALAEVYPGAIDLLVSDVSMPRLTGPDLAAALKAQRPGLRVLFVSGIHASDDLGGEPLLAKPFAMGNLVDKARELLGEE